jgi:type II secretory pathway pseudopilin PulG
MLFFTSRRNRQRAFTLVELLVIIAVIVLLTTLSMVALNNARAKSRDTERLTDIEQIKIALDKYAQNRTDGLYPAAPPTGTPITGLCFSNLGISSTCGSVVYIGELPGDPIADQDYVYTPTEDYSDYTLAFSLETGIEGYEEGNYQATPDGIVIIPGGDEEEEYSWITVGSALSQGSYTSLAITSDNIPYLAYKSGQQVVVKRFDNNDGWLTVGDNAINNSFYPTFVSLAFNSTNTPYVTYGDLNFEMFGGENDGWNKIKRLDNGSWTSVFDYYGSTGGSYEVSLVFDNVDNFYIAHASFSNGPHLRVGMNDYYGDQVSANCGYYSSVAINSQNIPYVAYADDTDCNDYGYNGTSEAVVKKYYNGEWTTVGVAGFVSSIKQISLAFANDDTPYVAYSDYNDNGKIAVMKYYNNSWTLVGTAGFSIGEAWYPSLVFNDNIPYVAYSDQGNSGKIMVMKYYNGEWTTVGTAGFSIGEAEYISLVFDSNGVPYVAYIDGGNGDKATVMKYDIVP